jgi:hypothetical protein
MLVWTSKAACATQSVMTEEPAPDPKKPAKSQRVQHREGRLKAALKANMARRKAQVRARGPTVPEADQDKDKE